MAKQFEAGKFYESYQAEYEPILVTRRTEKTIFVKNTTAEWKMKVRLDSNGNEYAIDTSVPKKWRDAFTYSPEWETENPRNAEPDEAPFTSLNPWDAPGMKVSDFI